MIRLLVWRGIIDAQPPRDKGLLNGLQRAYGVTMPSRHAGYDPLERGPRLQLT